jgi:hypothetical protein
MGGLGIKAFNLNFRYVIVSFSSFFVSTITGKKHKVMEQKMWKGSLFQYMEEKNQIKGRGWECSQNENWLRPNLPNDRHISLHFG